QSMNSPRLLLARVPVLATLVLLPTIVVSVVAGAPDRRRPTVTITAPTAGATLSGTVAVTGNASDNVAVSRVDVMIDSGPYTGATGTTAWSFSWQTTSVADGAHTLTARATDTPGRTSSASASVSGSNAAVGGVVGGGDAAGAIPTGLPKRFAVGLYEENGGNWMSTSGVRWDMRYRYFVRGWVNNWGWGAYDGSWGLAYLRECDSQGF